MLRSLRSRCRLRYRLRSLKQASGRYHRIKTARLRRNLATELVAERAGISRTTLWSVEKGSPTVAIGIYAAVLHALGGMDKDLELVAKDDELGRKLQDLNLVTRKRAKRG